MKTFLKRFGLFLYWALSLKGIMELINASDDLAFYAALFWLSLNIYLTIKLYKLKLL